MRTTGTASRRATRAWRAPTGTGEGLTDFPVPLLPEPHALLAVNTLLYPYSRFVYESIVGYIMGGNVFFVNAILMLFVKLMTMAICWSFAIFIAPIGLLYLYVHHSQRSAS
ncbi:hypothetical protein [Xanthomonas axonopodis]|uniref:hypothetical protein n=1 Tax=Xanthomonas axonopodis TaxID=53413 RepID=UPI002117F77C|nr:hypothetical protein [Xanthomonas axonopodis]